LLAERKCAGILIEGEATGSEAERRFIVVIGIGVNCANHPSSAQAGGGFPATDLQAHGTTITPESLFTRLSATMFLRLAQWDGGRGFPGILGDWLNHARGIGEPLVVRNGDIEMQGRFIGLDHAGRLVLERPDGGLAKIAAGDVFPFTVRKRTLARPV
jgi:BirA family transcriptional regulator, biotin operon repressor / biotin---[acetyl-CoA-carboxylase] ligase